MQVYTWVLLTAIFWGTAPLLGKLGLKDLSPYLALSIRSGVITIILLFFGLLTGRLGGLSQTGWRDWALLSGEGILSALLGHLAYFYALKAGETSRVIPLIAVYPLVTAALAIIFLGDKLRVDKIAGALLIAAGVFLLKR